MSSTIRILFLLRKSKLKKNGLAPITIRITINGKVVEFSSKIQADPALWNSTAGRMNGKSKIATEINTSLNFMLTRLNNKHRELLDRNGYVSPEKLRDTFLGIEEENYTLLKLYDKKISQKASLVGKTVTEDTVDKYRATKEKARQFILSYYAQKDIDIREVGYDFVTNYEIYLLSKGNCEHNTMVRHMRYLKQVTTDALRCKYITEDPFFDVSLESKRTKRNYLTEPELNRLTSKKLSDKVLEETRDIFVFQCLTGLAYIDIKNLTVSNIIKDANGNDCILKDRCKTGNESFIPLLSASKPLLKKYTKGKKAGDRIFPVSACQCMNRYLKEIAVLCGINKKLTSHVGRHTCATLMLTKGISIESVSKMLGHTDIKTTQIYAKILHEKVSSEVIGADAKFNSLAVIAQ